MVASASSVMSSMSTIGTVCCVSVPACFGRSANQVKSISGKKDTGGSRDTHGTHGTRGRTKAHGPHRRTSQPSKPTNNTHPARQRDDRSRGRLNSRRPGADRSPRPTQKSTGTVLQYSTGRKTPGEPGHLYSSLYRYCTGKYRCSTVPVKRHRGSRDTHTCKKTPGGAGTHTGHGRTGSKTPGAGLPVPDSCTPPVYRLVVAGQSSAVGVARLAWPGHSHSFRELSTTRKAHPRTGDSGARPRSVCLFDPVRGSRTADRRHVRARRRSGAAPPPGAVIGDA